MRTIDVKYTDCSDRVCDGKRVTMFNDEEGAGVCRFRELHSGVFENGYMEGYEYSIMECLETGELVEVIWR